MTREPRAIVALDVRTLDEALTLVDRLGEDADFYKVGSELFTAAGPDVVRALRDRGKDVFLDLKFHDIPNTVAGACRSAAALGARILTVHASGGRRMLEAARDAAGDGCGVLAVTVLTSLDAAELGQAWGRSAPVIEDEVLRLAERAAQAGLHGIVCSGQEAAQVRDRHGDALALLIPGLRASGAATQDQSRVVTPEAALEAGASYLVLGRMVSGAEDPVEVLRSVDRARRSALGARRSADRTTL